MYNLDFSNPVATDFASGSEKFESDNIFEEYSADLLSSSNSEKTEFEENDVQLIFDADSNSLIKRKNRLIGLIQKPKHNLGCMFRVSIKYFLTFQKNQMYFLYIFINDMLVI